MTATAFKLVAGHPALDVLNTVQWRLDPSRAVEDLPTYADVLRWCTQAGLLDSDTAAGLDAVATARPRHAAAEHRRVIELRETAYAALIDHSPVAIDDLAAYHRAAIAHAVLAPSMSAWGWADKPVSLRTPRDRLARSMIALLTTSDLTYLRQCEDDACGWVFLDTSPRRNRRWCSAADCGSRNRARQYYSRRQEGTTEKESG